jgi:hypothetical protein
LSNILDGNNYVTKEELKRLQNGNATAVYLNPEDNCVYAGETVDSKGRVVPTYEAKIYDRTEYQDAKIMKEAGKLDRDELPYKGWTPEFLPLFTERIQMKEAGVVTNTVFSAIDTTTVLNGFRNVNIRDFTIPDVVTNIPTNGLEMQIDVYTRFNISVDVPEGVRAWSKRGGSTTVSFDLTKDVGHISATDEALLKSRQNLWQTHITNVATDFKRAKSAKIADVLETATETNVGDWDAFTSGLSDANPVGHVNLRLDAIKGNNGEVDTIVSHNVGWSAFSSNTFVHGPYQNFGDTQPGISANARIIPSLAQIAGVKWAIDNELLSTSVIVMDSSSVVCVNGPTRVGQYRMEAEGIDGYVAREWYQCQIVEAGKIAELTTVTT